MGFCGGHNTGLRDGYLHLGYSHAAARRSPRADRTRVLVSFRISRRPRTPKKTPSRKTKTRMSTLTRTTPGTRVFSSTACPSSSSAPTTKQPAVRCQRTSVKLLLDTFDEPQLEVMRVLFPSNDGFPEGGARADETGSGRGESGVRAGEICSESRRVYV